MVKCQSRYLIFLRPFFNFFFKYWFFDTLFFETGLQSLCFDICIWIYDNFGGVLESNTFEDLKGALCSRVLEEIDLETCLLAFASGVLFL